MIDHNDNEDDLKYHESKEQKTEIEEEEELEIPNENDLHNLERKKYFKHKKREERKKLRQQRLMTFAKSRLQQERLHYNNTLEIQNSHRHSKLNINQYRI